MKKGTGPFFIFLKSTTCTLSTSGAFLWRGDYECIKCLNPEEYDYDSNTNSHQVAYDGPSFTKVNIFRKKSFDIEGIKYAYNAYYAEDYIYHIVMFSRVSIDQNGDYRSEQGEICICGNYHLKLLFTLTVQLFIMGFE